VAGASYSLLSAWNTSSTVNPKNRASAIANGSDGRYRPVSIALTVWRDTPTAVASSACESPRPVLSSRTSFRTCQVCFTDERLSSSLYINPPTGAPDRFDAPGAPKTLAPSCGAGRLHAFIWSCSYLISGGECRLGDADARSSPVDALGSGVIVASLVVEDRQVE
jgi:hypothetical protein